MAKQEFRRQKSLASDLNRWQLSLTDNETELNSKFSVISKIIGDLITNHNGNDVSSYAQKIDAGSSALRDVLFDLEGTLTEIGSIEDDLINLQISTDTIIQSLRELKEQSRQMQSSTEYALKLILKSKRATDQESIRDEIEDATNKVKNDLTGAKSSLNQITENLKQTLVELEGLEQSSKDLLQRKIM